MQNLDSPVESKVEEWQNAEGQTTSFLIWACVWIAALAVLLPALP